MLVSRSIYFPRPDPKAVVKALKPCITYTLDENNPVMMLQCHRNPLIADLFSRAGKVERAGTGIRRIRDLLAQTGCAEPQFRFTAFFDLVLPRHTQRSGTTTDLGPGGDQVGTKSVPSRYQVEVLKFCLTERSLVEIIAKFGVKFGKTNRTRFRDEIIRSLTEANLLSPTIPDKPRSRFQKYITTAAGAQWMQEEQA